MPTTVRLTEPFEKDLKRLAKKYPLVRDEIENLIAQLQSDQRPGNKIPRIGYDVYKTRLPNPSAARGKSGGFRVVYYVQMADSVILLTIYSKTSKNDISVKEIQRAVEDVTSPDVL